MAGANGRTPSPDPAVALTQQCSSFSQAEDDAKERQLATLRAEVEAQVQDARNWIDGLLGRFPEVQRRA